MPSYCDLGKLLLNINMAIINGMSDRYFSFTDGSNVGIVTTGNNRVQFIPGTLSGATQAPPKWVAAGRRNKRDRLSVGCAPR